MEGHRIRVCDLLDLFTDDERVQIVFGDTRTAVDRAGALGFSLDDVQLSAVVGGLFRSPKRQCIIIVAEVDDYEEGTYGDGGDSSLSM